MSFRNAIARRALENVQAYMGRFNIHETEEYVGSAFSYHGEVPFLYRNFRPTEEVEPDPQKEPGGFKVVRSPVPFSASSLHLTPQPTDPSWTLSASSHPPDDVDVLPIHQI